MVQILLLLSVCKNSVCFAKVSYIQSQLEMTLKSAEATRRNSNLNTCMMQSVAANVDRF